MTKTISEITKKQLNVVYALAELKKEYDDAYTQLVNLRNSLEKEMEIALGGFAQEKIDLGLKCVNIYISKPMDGHGSATRSAYGRGDTVTAVEDAIKDVSNGCPHLKELYIGCKDYSRYAAREDHSYGMGPKWGNDVFSIGLTSAYRKSGLNAEQTEAVLYVLTGLKNSKEFRHAVFGINE